MSLRSRTDVAEGKRSNPYNAQQIPSVKWTEEGLCVDRACQSLTSSETETFYKALSCCGTDFDLISRFFPNRCQRQIKVVV
jgi:hypothetical protein